MAEQLRQAHNTCFPLIDQAIVMSGDSEFPVFMGFHVGEMCELPKPSQTSLIMSNHWDTQIRGDLSRQFPKTYIKLYQIITY